VAHFDLYRTSGQGFSPDLEEILDSDAFCLVEWAEFLPAASRPDSFVNMVWNVEDEIRTVQFSAGDKTAQEFLDRVSRDVF
jgi:tRNA threonylcarbamoyladenosine biosynthesis protein TsaE